MRVCLRYTILVPPLMSILLWIHLFIVVHRKCTAIQGQFRKLYIIQKYYLGKQIIDRSTQRTTFNSRLDYCCSLLHATKKTNIHHLQCLESSPARFIHWLPAQERNNFRIHTFVFKCSKLTVPQVSHRITIDTPFFKRNHIKQGT